MAVTAEASGTQTAVIDTEHFVEDTNVTGVFVFEVDTDAMVTGDVLELRIYQIILTAGTARVSQYAIYYGEQLNDELKSSAPVANELTDAQSLRFSLKQIRGTGRNFPWKVLKIAS